MWWNPKSNKIEYNVIMYRHDVTVAFFDVMYSFLLYFVTMFYFSFYSHDKFSIYVRAEIWRAITRELIGYNKSQKVRGAELLSCLSCLEKAKKNLLSLPSTPILTENRIIGHIVQFDHGLPTGYISAKNYSR